MPSKEYIRLPNISPLILLYVNQLDKIYMCLSNETHFIKSLAWINTDFWKIIIIWNWSGLETMALNGRMRRFLQTLRLYFLSHFLLWMDTNIYHRWTWANSKKHQQQHLMLSSHSLHKSNTNGWRWRGRPEREGERQRFHHNHWNVVILTHFISAIRLVVAFAWQRPSSNPL